jgi:anti-sigma B factor antagonist
VTNSPTGHVQGRPLFTCDVRDGDGVVHIALVGELDLAVVEECRASLAGPLKRRDATFHLDLTELEFTDSTGLRLLLEIRSKAEASNCRVMLVGISAPVSRLLQVSGVGDIFPRLEPEPEPA